MLSSVYHDPVKLRILIYGFGKDWASGSTLGLGAHLIFVADVQVTPKDLPQGPSETGGIMAEDHSDGIHVVVIGAGLAGLAVALSTKLANPLHQVTVCETVKELQEIGVSAIQCLYAPFSLRILSVRYSASHDRQASR